MARFKDMPMDPAQMVLYASSVDEALPADSDVRIFRDMMDCLDYSGLISKCSSTGRPPYHPEIMAKILGYAYSKGIRSSRQIEQMLYVDVRLIWLAGGLKPDHNTIARFRKESGKELGLLFKDSVRLCCEAGLVYLNAVATDGSKIQSAASKKSVYSQSKLDRALGRVDKILQEAEEADLAEDELYGSGNGNSNDLPKNLRDARSRKAKLENIANRLKETDRSSVVDTDADARVMMTTQGKRPCYNLQASVDAANQVIVAMELTRDENDRGKLPEMTQQVESNTGLSPDLSLTDCGYGNEDTIQWAEDNNYDVLMPFQEQPQESARNDLFCSKCFLPDGNNGEDALICPAGRKLTFRGIDRTGSGNYRRYCANGCQSCSFYRQCVPKGRGSRRVNISVVADQRKAMREKLQSPEGKAKYALRQQTVEPVFGQIKSNLGLDRFLCWGIAGASAEVALACLAHNIVKCAANALAHAFVASISAALYIQMLQAEVLARLCYIHKMENRRIISIGSILWVPGFETACLVPKHREHRG
jgi:transposase